MVDSDDRTEDRRWDHEDLPSPVSISNRDAPLPTRYVFEPRSGQIDNIRQTWEMSP